MVQERLAFASDYAALFSSAAQLQGMLDFEAALARSLANLGIVPERAADIIAQHCRAERFDAEALAAEKREAGNPAIPMVHRLTALVAADDEEAARYVHWGATSQDAIDTGMVLQSQRALARLLAALEANGDALAHLTEQHKSTAMAGRTLLQHALPITFGMKTAGWLDSIDRQAAGLAKLGRKLLVLQLGGAVGTRASLAGRGREVAQRLAGELSLPHPLLSWHTARDRWLELGAALARLVAVLGKIARDVALLMQTEVAEVFEPRVEGRGGSSTLPHKRNPVLSTAILAAAARTPGLIADLHHAAVQEHERGVGGWHAEWDLIPELFCLAGDAAENARIMLEGLEVDGARMRANLEMTRGQILAEAVTTALAPTLGRAQAHDLVGALCRKASRQGGHLRDVMAADDRVTELLSPTELQQVFDSSRYIGEAEELAERVLAAHRRRRAGE